MKRKDMLNGCPEEFKPRMEDIIDEIEDKVGYIRDPLNVQSISDLQLIETAYDKASELCSDLY